MSHKKKGKNRQIRELARSLFYNKKLSNKEIAEKLACSIRTVIHWKRSAEDAQSDRSPKVQRRQIRPRRYEQGIFDRIRDLKEKNPNYTAAIIHRQVQEENNEKIPSESSIRKYLISQGFHFKHIHNREGYIKFQREKPNDLWQIECDTMLFDQMQDVMPRIIN